MPHLRPLGDLVDPRLGVAGRRGARRRLLRFLTRPTRSDAPRRERPPLWFERAGRNVTDVPEVWQVVEAPERPARWAVVLHDVGGVELERAVADLLGDEHPPFDLYVLSRDPVAAEGQAVAEGIASSRVLPALAEGDDWALCALVNAGLLDAYEVILRRSTARVPRASSLSPDTLLDAFAADASLGFVCPTRPTLIRPRRSRLGVRRLLRRLELSTPRQRWAVPAGHDYWARGFLLQGLRALNLSREDFTSCRARRATIDPLTFGQLLGALAAEAGCSVIGDSELADTTVEQREREDRARILALYLPQFHPIEENDKWWGAGFTEWTNVTSARPVYRGHFQPKLPLDLGFYDLRLDATRRVQARLAAAHGVAGFMYYHYWFAGKPLLEQPINALLRSDLDYPFCIMWANENWTRAWDGGTSEILMAQNYDDVPAASFIDDAMPLLRDRRYVRIGDNALLAVYRPGQIPDFPAVVAKWRSRAAEHGVGLFVVSVDVSESYDALDGPPESYGLDGHMGFPPHRRLHAPTVKPWVRPKRRFTGMTYDYGAMVRADEETLRDGLDSSAFPGIMVGFDNTARRQWSSVIWVGSNPYTFRRWLNAAVDAVGGRPHDKRVVFVNAWNEWAEGAILEPTTRFGNTYLLAVRDAVGGRRCPAGDMPVASEVAIRPDRPPQDVVGPGSRLPAFQKPGG